MYKIGDYVFCEVSPSSPHQIRRIEELNKAPNGNVEAKMMCFYRRRDLSGSLVMLADKHHSALEEDQEREAEQLSEKQKHQLKHREVFLSRQIETLPATCIRGKCSVTLLNETESLTSYLNQEDTFFYTLVYDPQQKTLLADKGEIRVGSKYQAEVPPLTLEAAGATDDRILEELETLVFKPDTGLTDQEIQQYLIVAKSIGTFARALDHGQPSLHMSAAAASRDVTIAHAMDVLHQSNYDIGQAVLSLVPSTGPTLCRDEMEEWSSSEANLFEEALEKYGKDFNDIRQDFLSWKTMKNIVEYYYMWKTTDRCLQQKRVKAVEAENKLKQVYIPNYNGKTPVNGNVLNDALNGKPCESCGKTSTSQWYPWGSPQISGRLCQGCWTYWRKYGGLKYPSRIGNDIVSLPFPNIIYHPKLAADRLNSPLRTNDATSPQYPCRECDKVFSRQERLMAHQAIHKPQRCTLPGCGKEFKFKTQLARHCAQAHGVAIRAGSPRPIMKTRAAFYLQTVPAAKLARKLCSQILKIKHAARNPFNPINVALIKQECQTKLSENSSQDMPILKPVTRGKVVDVSHKLGTPQQESPEWLIPIPKDELPVPERLAFPPPERDKDGQFIIPRPTEPKNVELSSDSSSSVNKNVAPWGINNLSTSHRKRPYDQTNGGSDVSPPIQLKRRSLAPPVMNKPSNADVYGMAGMPRGALIPSMNGRPKIATITRIGGGRKQMINWVDAPDDLYFVATDSSKRYRKSLGTLELRKAARRPWRRVPSRNNDAIISNSSTVVTN